MTQLRLRRAAHEDARLLWVWCNDNMVRTQAFSPQPIPWSEHVAWLDRTLTASDSCIWILECGDGGPAGQVRADAVDGQAKIDYSIAAEHRGRGLAPRLLRLAAPTACETLHVQAVIGVVKTANVPSCRAFESAGFVLAESVVERGHPCRRYEWRLSWSMKEMSCGC